jgi:hypothetical protein
MSTASETQPAVEPTEQPAERRLTLAHQMVMLDHIKKTLGINRKHLERYRDQTMDQAMGAYSAESAQDGDDMLVLGNVTFTEQAPTAVSASSSDVSAPVAAVTEKASTLLSGLKKGALVAALLGAGAGIPVGIAAMLPERSEPTPAAPSGANLVDTDTISQIEVDK